jgi:hypothetical protein
MEIVMLRDRQWRTFPGEILRRISLEGFEKLKLAVTVPNEGIVSISELNTGLAIASADSEKKAIYKAIETLKAKGYLEFESRLEKVLIERGVLNNAIA